MSHASVYQPQRKDEFDVHSQDDLFVRLPNGNSIRLRVEDNGLVCMEGNGTTIRLTTVACNCPAIKMESR